MIVYTNRNGNLKHFGGRGYLLDKGGSGFHIGRDAICAAQDARDGTGKHTILTDLVEDKIGNTVWESIQDIYSKTSPISHLLHRVYFLRMKTEIRLQNRF